MERLLTTVKQAIFLHDMYPVTNIHIVLETLSDYIPIVVNEIIVSYCDPKKLRKAKSPYNTWPWYSTILNLYGMVLFRPVNVIVSNISLVCALSSYSFLIFCLNGSRRKKLLDINRKQSIPLPSPILTL